jgi:hypothetical protein
MTARLCLKNMLRVVAHAYNPSYLEGRGRRIKVLGHPWEHKDKTLSEKRN